MSARVLLSPRNADATLAFYRDQLGLAIARTYPGGVVFFAGSTLIEVASHMSADGPEDTLTALWLQVRDTDRTQRELERAGVTITRETRTEPWGLKEMHVSDPDGRRIIFVEIPPDHPLRTDLRANPTG